MNRTLLAPFTIVYLASGAAYADPISLTSNQMDQVTAGLTLPNGNTVLDNFDTPAPGPLHPSFGRSDTANQSTSGIPASGDPADGFSGSNEGPWSAHFQSPVIGI